jgi:hypothetical protein
MNILTINGKTYSVEGGKIVVRQNQGHGNGSYVKVNNVIIENNIQSDNIVVTFQGDLASLDCTSAVINGNIQGNVNATSVKCGDVSGDIEGTNVKCGNVLGKIDAVNVQRK